MLRIVSELKYKITVPLLPPQEFYIINPSNKSRMSSALYCTGKGDKKNENEKLYYFPLSTPMWQC